MIIDKKLLNNRPVYGILVKNSLALDRVKYENENTRDSRSIAQTGLYLFQQTAAG